MAYAQDKTLVWDRFDVDISVNTDGTFDVAEHQTIRFINGSFTKGFRDILKNNFSYLDQWSLIDSQGNSYQQSWSGDPYTFSVDDQGGRYVINWYFPPTANSTETYTLSYRVHDGLRYYEGGDQVWWKAIYSDRPFPVLAGRVRVSAPPGASIEQWAAYINETNARDMAVAERVSDASAIVFDLQQQLNSGEDFEVRVQFTAGVAAGAVQPWQARADEAAAQREAELAYQAQWRPIALLGFGLAGLLFLLGGPAALYALWYNFGRDKPVEMVADYLPEPPDELPPGVVGALLDETVDMQDIIATLVDLARRKAISITEEKTENWFSNSTDFIYKRERDDVELNGYEKKLLNAVFGSKDEVRLSDLKNRFYKKLPGIKDSMYDALIDANLFVRKPDTVRTQYAALGIVALIISVGVGIVLLAVFGELTGAAVLPAIGMGATALGLLILSRHMPRKTDGGSETAAKWRAFRTYLRNIDRYSDVESQKEIWDRWLPYAIAFGIDREYIRAFEAVEAPAPGWYFPSPEVYGPYRRGYYGRPWIGPRTGSGREAGGSGPIFQGGERSPGGGLSDMSRGLGTSLAGMSAGLSTMLNSASSTMTSRPVETSSGSGWSGSSNSGGWSGGGGFSGGGSFGGGGGGGGGGGFS
ncbi:MAG: DUF2207 domain-containing protein [Caldilineaceae bacterium]